MFLKIGHCLSGPSPMRQQSMLVKNMNSGVSLPGFNSQPCSLGGRRVWGRIDTSLCPAESLCCPPETITALFIGYTVAQPHQTLCNHMVYSPPGSSVHRILKVRIESPSPSPGGLPEPGIKARSHEWQTSSLLSEPYTPI